MRKVVIIEDEVPLLDSISDMLTYASYDVTPFRNGLKALEHIREQTPDIVLCDIMMPVIDGFQILQALRDDPQTATIPFIFLTAKADRDSMRSGMNLGADDYLTKPFTLEELLSALETRIERQQIIVENLEQGLDALKHQLAHVIMYELRSPLVSINTVMKVIAHQFGNLSESEFQEMIDTVEAGSNRLNHRVEQLVYLTQIESGALSADAIAAQGGQELVAGMLANAVEIGQQFAFQQPPGLRLNLQLRDTAIRVICNCAALEHAFAEVIANALLFSRPDGIVTVTLSRINGKAWVSVTDMGSGIPPGKLATAVEDADHTSGSDNRIRRNLGLPLAKRIIENHGGRLEIQSSLGKGTQVFITLPALD